MSDVLEPMLTRTEVEKATGLGRSAIYDRMQRHEFPRPLKFSSRSVRWKQSEITAWVAAAQRAKYAAPPERR